ncbi:NIPSNAP family protein [Bosea caraganae]|uniref:NIPSNAP family protein n=1 Tax=Bosea caraganae TaxID=2763117 RepID=A0A370L9J0_9HYPH|nr:NIPSNAP family protein [Bosea caraganae]RDJ26947.1 NIPSNAP family protein [Bosea caraganae]RDJ30834.1 NIPSNAP family protein [Bosea caraganae]
MASAAPDLAPNAELHWVAYLDLKPQMTAAALAGIGQWLQGDGSAGRLRACWYSVLGPAHRILLWRSFDGAAALDAAGLELACSDNPYGVGDCLVRLSGNAFRKVPFAGDLPETSAGPFFELRDYTLKLDGLDKLMELWRPLLPARLSLAPWVTAMYALTGTAPRMLHIYPWTSLEQRTEIRDGAAAIGWPPAEAPRQILHQDVTIYRAAEFSPLGGAPSCQAADIRQAELAP